MSEEDKNVKPEEGSAENAGSPEQLIQEGPSANKPDGEPQKSADDQKEDVDLKKYVSKDQYEEAQSTIGRQGKELGDMRNFFQEISPLLDKLQAQPELVEAIMEDKLTSDLAKSVLEGKVKLEDATKVAEAHEDVKKDMGTKKYDEAKPEDIEKLVADKIEQKLAEQRKSFEKGMSEIEERREFENATNKFIENTSDFDVYADKVVKWFEEHPDQYDIRVAYEAVKGREALVNSQAKADADAAEQQKKMAVPGGQSQGAQVIDDRDAFDDLVNSQHNPNVL